MYSILFLYHQLTSNSFFHTLILNNDSCKHIRTAEKLFKENS